MNSLQPNAPAECAEFLEAFAQAQRGVTKRREAGWLRFRYAFDKDWRDSYTLVHRFIDQQVERALKETEKEDDQIDLDSPPARKRYVLLDEMAKHIRDPIQLRYQVLGVFLPARESTSIAVGNTLFQLARHPDIWTQLRRISLELGDEPLTFEKLKSLVEFRYVLLETIRLVGPAARVWRVALRDTVLPSGGGPDRKSPVFVPKGTAVVMGTWCVQHDRDLWGDDVEEFKPDRWIGRQPRWEFVPFLGGPRKCPAQQQVLTHAVYILVRLTQRFESIENRDPVLEYIERFTMGFENRNGVKVAFKQA
jgi:cytochrome P450 monooxygenase